jgi:hypothetical protein
LYMSTIYVYPYVCLLAPIAVCQWCLSKERFIITFVIESTYAFATWLCHSDVYW